MWNWIKKLFGFGKKAEAPKKPTAPVITPQSIERTVAAHKSVARRRAVTRANIRRSDYYRRGNKYYYADDDSLIEDLFVLALVMDAFGDTRPTDVVEPEINDNIESDVDAIDAAEERIRAAYVAPEPEPRRTPEPAYSEPEPSRSYDSGSSYDSGGGDCGGGCD